MYKMIKIFCISLLGLLGIAAILFTTIIWLIDHEFSQRASLIGSQDIVLPLANVKQAGRLNDSRFEPQHPHLASAGTSTMHAGGYNSDTHLAATHFQNPPEIQTRRVGGKLARQCATFTFTSEGYPLILCGGFTSFKLKLINPDNLHELANYDLPMRPSSFQALVKRDLTIIFSDTSGGAYFYLDNKDRVIIADSKQFISRLRLEKTSEGKWSFVVDKKWDMRSHVPHDCLHYNNLFPSGECDALTTVMPDKDGLMWWVTRFGRIGTLNPETDEVYTSQLAGEEIQNSFAVAEDGVFIVSDHAMYGLEAVNGKPEIMWREPYDRGTSRKSGSINQGSGTTPTLLGNHYVTFTDNQDNQINIIVLRREKNTNGQSREVCKVPVFSKGASATDNSMIGYGNSIILENNHGYANAATQTTWDTITGGVVRVDVREDESGCDVVWTSDLKVPSVVPKLSLGSGIAYFYSFDLTQAGTPLWALVGLNFQTGEEVVRIPTGTGTAYNNNWSSIGIDQDGLVYVGTREGFLQIK